MRMKGTVSALVAAVSVVGGAHALAAESMPASITMNTAGFIPEGVEYDTKNKRFLVGSLARGTVFVVGANGTLTPFIQDPDLKSSVGIEVDEERNRLLVANSDSAVFGGQSPGQAKLGVYDLGTGKRLAMVDLGAVGPSDAKAHFANDLTVGPDGSAYITDTQARVIYKVTPKYAASVFLALPAAERLNGIVANPHGYLLVAESAAGDIYKVPLAKPEGFGKVKLPEPVSGADGLLWHPKGCLIVVRNDKSQLVIALKSADDWASATMDSKGTSSTQQTTAALVDSGVYVVHPFFNDAKAMPALEHVQLK
jgi:sugar lactone lactonase YvrE